MKTLSMSTSSNICTAAVLEDTKLLKESIIEAGTTHSVNLMPMIQNLLEDLNLKLNNMDLIVCDKGPGSFTGIRIGVATAKAFSDSLNINSVGISSLEALAYNVKEPSVICPMIDARNNNIYVGVFEKKEGQYILRRDFSSENIFEFLEELQDVNYNATFVGDASIKYKEEILNVLPNSKFASINNVTAYNLGLAGLENYLNNKKNDLLPLYLKKSQAEIKLVRNDG